MEKQVESTNDWLEGSGNQGGKQIIGRSIGAAEEANSSLPYQQPVCNTLNSAVTHSFARRTLNLNRPNPTLPNLVRLWAIYGGFRKLGVPCYGLL